MGIIRIFKLYNTASHNFNTTQGGSVALQITWPQPLKFVETGDGSEASLMWLSAGALACIQDDGCFTLVCGDSSLCLCLTKCQQVSYSKNLAVEAQSVTPNFTASILCN